MTFGITGDVRGNTWTGPETYAQGYYDQNNVWHDMGTVNYPPAWPPYVIMHEFGHYGLGLYEEYDSTLNPFCENEQYDTSMMATRGHWLQWEYWYTDTSGNRWYKSCFDYYSEMCTESIHTPGMSYEGIYLDHSCRYCVNLHYTMITAPSTPAQGTDPPTGTGGALSFVIMNVGS